MEITPTLSAMMCDGMGWFRPVDYKRMLLIYDEIHYLLPKVTTEFQDITGRREQMFFPVLFSEQNRGFFVHHYTPEEEYRKLIIEAAIIDAERTAFAAVVEHIPSRERLYTWRVVNSDARLGKGKSLGVRPEQDVLAHAILLNTFLLAADAKRTIPITGKDYIHRLISAKYRANLDAFKALRPDVFGDTLRGNLSAYNPIAERLVSALVPDQELEARTEHEILEFKEKNGKLFQQFSFFIRKFIAKIKAMPHSPEFQHELDDMFQTDIWQEKTQVEDELRAAWSRMFSNALKAGVGAAVGVGITPLLSLGSITLASILTAGTAVTPWAVTELLTFLDARKKTERNGLYYLTKFGK